MNVRTLCLAILQFADATGYEIKKMASEPGSAYAYFVDASFGSIYPALTRLERDGMVTSREEREPGKPARRIYSITQEGRAELMASLGTAPEPDIFRSEFLLIAMCAELLSPATVAKAIDHRLRQLDEEMARIAQAESETGHPGTCWIARYGMSCMKASRDHLARHRGELEAIAGTSLVPPVAAE